MHAGYRTDRHIICMAVYNMSPFPSCIYIVSLVPRPTSARHFIWARWRAEVGLGMRLLYCAPRP